MNSVPFPEAWKRNKYSRWFWILDKQTQQGGDSPFLFKPWSFLLRCGVASAVIFLLCGPLGAGVAFWIESQHPFTLKGAIIFKAAFGLVVAACVGPVAALPVLFSFHQHYRAEYPPDSDLASSNAPFLQKEDVSDEKVRWNSNSNNSPTVHAVRAVSTSEALHGLDCLDDTTTQSERGSIATHDSFLSVLSDRPFLDPDSGGP